MITFSFERKDGINKKLHRKSDCEVQMAHGHVHKLGYLKISSVKKPDWGPL